MTTFLHAPDLAAGIAFAILAIGAVAAIVYIQEGQRRIPIQYASRVRGRRMYQGGATFLPLRVNQAGVIPIIFAVSILLFPVQLATLLPDLDGGFIAGHVANFIIDLLDQQAPLYVAAVLPADRRLHVLLHGVHVQARRDGRPAAQERRLHPGHPTRRARPVTTSPRSSIRISLAGALFLGIVAVSPIVLSSFFAGSVVGSFSLGGTALLIVVSVVVETMKQLEAQLMMRNYEGFIR